MAYTVVSVVSQSTVSIDLHTVAYAGKSIHEGMSSGTDK